ncbi:MAG: hypothetical protein IT162_21010 [Bryobacterales bacterium]|nr:hypothetical protein [Bryobacterales bacterium]
MKEGRGKVSHAMAVEYAMGTQSVLLPARTTYTRRQNAMLYVETECVYSDFKMFGADANITFTVEGEEALKQP